MAIALRNTVTRIGAIDGPPFLAVELDVSTSEVQTLTATVTDHPVEEGSNIADHIRDDPDELQIDGVITNTPLEYMASLRNSGSRAENGWLDLIDIKESHAPVTVMTPERTHENMVITSLSRTRTASIGDAVQVSLKLKSIRKVSALTADAPVRKIRKPKTSSPKVMAQAAQAQSVLSSLLGM